MGGKTIEEQAHSYNELLFHIYQQLANLGFKGIFVMCGHGPLPLYANFTAEVFMRKNSVRIFATDEASLISAYSKELGCPVEEGDDWRGDHAGKWETSILMALYPDLVDISLLPKNKDADNNFNVTTVALSNLGKLFIINSKSINTPCYT